MIRRILLTFSLLSTTHLWGSDFEIELEKEIAQDLDKMDLKTIDDLSKNRQKKSKPLQKISLQRDRMQYDDDTFLAVVQINSTIYSLKDDSPLQMQKAFLVKAKRDKNNPNVSYLLTKNETLLFWTHTANLFDTTEDVSLQPDKDGYKLYPPKSVLRTLDRKPLFSTTLALNYQFLSNSYIGENGTGSGLMSALMYRLPLPLEAGVTLSYESGSYEMESKANWSRIAAGPAARYNFYDFQDLRFSIYSSVEKSFSYQTETVNRTTSFSSIGYTLALEIRRKIFLGEGLFSLSNRTLWPSITQSSEDFSNLSNEPKTERTLIVSIGHYMSFN